MLLRCLPLAFFVLALWAPDARAEKEPVPDRTFTYTHRTMGTSVVVTVWGDNEALAAKGAKAVFDEFERVNKLMSSWLDTGDVARINKAAGKRFTKVDKEVFQVLQKTRQFANKTKGAFDVTVGAFRGLWKFDQDRDGGIPKKSAVKKRRKLVDYKRLLLKNKGRQVKLKTKGMRLTLGGIAKGHAVDRSVAILHKMGLVDFIVQAGGDLYASGQKGNRQWRVGIRDPRGARDASFALASVKDATFSTSGDYERFVLKDGVRYHHILDPRTGYPAKGTRSVTVKAKDATTADAWSTALLVIGAKKGMPLVEKEKDLEAVFVDGDNQVHVSTGLKGTLHIIHPPTDGV